MINLFIAFLLIFSQDSKIEFQIVNPSKDTIKLEIPGFNVIILTPGQTSTVRFQKGQEVLCMKDVNEDDKEERLVLLVVDESHRGQTLKVDKLLRLAEKRFQEDS